NSYALVCNTKFAPGVFAPHGVRDDGRAGPGSTRPAVPVMRRGICTAVQVFLPENATISLFLPDKPRYARLLRRCASILEFAQLCKNHLTHRAGLILSRLEEGRCVRSA